MIRFKKITLTLTMACLAGACGEKSNNAPLTTSTQVNMERMHSTTKAMIGIEESKPQENQEPAAGEPQERNQVDLDNKFSLLSPQQYEPIITKLVEESAKKSIYSFARRYMTREMTTWDDKKKGCIVIEEVLNTVLVGARDDFRTLEEISVDEEASDPCYKNHIEKNRVMLGLYRSIPLTLDSLKADLANLQKMQVYKVDDRSFIIHDQLQTITISFLENGFIHMDGVLRENGKDIAVISQIPLKNASRKDFQDLDGVRLPAKRQVDCETEDSEDICTEMKPDDFEKFNFLEYYQLALEHTREN